MIYFDLLVFLFLSSGEIGFQNQIQLVGTNYGGMVAFRMAEMYPNFVKKVVISSSGVDFVSTSLDELLARSNLSSISELMLPSSVKGMKVFLANVTYKAIWLLNFILHDMLQVSLAHHHPLSQT
jgi:pimeloyl-ACP methyl ester carboxylesterase